jgi:hypothetical protein
MEEEKKTTKEGSEKKKKQQIAFAVAVRDLGRFGIWSRMHGCKFVEIWGDWDLVADEGL